MNNLDYISLLDQKIAALDKIVERGEYLAAGLHIQVTVGASERNPDLDIELGMTAELEVIMSMLRAGLKSSRDFRVHLAREELQKLQSFFEKEPSAKTTAGSSAENEVHDNGH